jgi:hypothetical protein
VSLRCVLYKHPVDEGLNFCPECRTGFTSQLECAACGRLVPRGSASCFSCARPASSPVSSSSTCTDCGSLQFATPSGFTCENGHGGDPGRALDPRDLQVRGPGHPALVALQSPQSAPPVAPWLPPHVSLAAPVASTFVVRQGGVEAEVRVPPGDAEVMDLMGQMVVILHTFASKVNTLTGHSELTRGIIRSARALANDVQEDLEQRKGPGR